MDSHLSVKCLITYVSLSRPFMTNASGEPLRLVLLPDDGPLRLPAVLMLIGLQSLIELSVDGRLRLPFMGAARLSWRRVPRQI